MRKELYIIHPKLIIKLVNKRSKNLYIKIFIIDNNFREEFVHSNQHGARTLINITHTTYLKLKLNRLIFPSLKFSILSNYIIGLCLLFVTNGVSQEIRFVFGPIVTILAGIRSFSRVNTHVSLKSGWIEEFLTAEGAGVYLETLLRMYIARR